MKPTICSACFRTALVAIALVVSGAPAALADPTVVTEAATSVGPSSAQLNAYINPNGDTITWYFEYGLNGAGSYGAYGSDTSSTNSSGTTGFNASAAITGLSPNTTYHFSIVAARPNLGLTSGNDVTFTTLPPLPQDNWYPWQTNSPGFSPYGVAFGPDGRLFAADLTHDQIQVCSNGVWSVFARSNFSGTLTFGKPGGMITDASGNLYVADYTGNCVDEFASTGSFVRRIGGVGGSAPGQLSGVVDVAVSSSGSIYLLENGNSRLSVFNPDGTFQAVLIPAGSLDGQLASPSSMAISDGGKIFIAQNRVMQVAKASGGETEPPGAGWVKVFDLSGNFLYKFYAAYDSSFYGFFGPCTVRLDSSGLLHVIEAFTLEWGTGWPIGDTTITWAIYNSEGTPVTTYPVSFGQGLTNSLPWPCAAVGPDGTMVIAGAAAGQVQQFLYAKRELNPVPKNAPSLPEVISVQQRAAASIVDISYKVTDLDDSNTFAAMLVFTNGVQSLTDCLLPRTFVEGTDTNINTTVPTGQPLHVAWNAGADWPATNVNSFRVAILAKDNRQGLLEVHYLGLPARGGQPALQISASPLAQTDFSQVWWWLLATNDPGITLSNGVISGVGGAADGLALCNGDYNTTADGRAYIYAKMNVREATPAEVSWASQGAVTGNTNQWTPTVTVAGRPRMVNEYGFDTGNWSTNVWWIVPLP